jgi:tetratricopeptide (TPR) repeat protein
MAASRRRLAIGQLRACLLPLALFMALARPLAAQERLLDRKPFDQVVLDRASGGTVLDVFPLPLARRPLAVLPKEGRLSLQLLDRPSEQFEVSWSSVAEIRLYEQMLLAEAKRLYETDQNFDEAYEYFARLLAEYPTLPNLNNEVNAYLRLNALSLHRAQQQERALSLLMSLRERNPSDQALPNAIEAVAGEVIQQHLRNRDYAAARAVLDLWQTQFRGIATTAAENWQTQFEAAAERQVAEARRFVDQKQYLEARGAARRAIAIWPNLRAAGEILARIQREYPSVTVGVFEIAPRQPAHRIDNWASLRASRLSELLLAEQVGFAGEGGEYRSPLGKLTIDETRSSLRLQIENSRLMADQIARFLLSMADRASPDYDEGFANLLAGVSIGGDNSVELRWQRAHVRPEALLQFPLPRWEAVDGAVEPAAARFSVVDYEPSQVVFAAAGQGTGIRSEAGSFTQPPPAADRLQFVVERFMPDDDAAVSALLAGEIDVLDRVPPWQVSRLRAADGVRVSAYRLPTIHVLIPQAGRPLSEMREFRRALCYGIDRNWIVDRVFLGGARQAGFEVVSGPFPVGVSPSDPIRYGHNSQLAPRPFEPRLAAILSAIAWSSVQKKQAAKEGDATGDGPIADFPELILAHPSDPLARTACQLIQMQLGRVGIPIKLREFTAEELASGNVDCDLRYAELAVWEPLTDARRIFGPGGLAGDAPSPYILSALRRLDAATNWKDVRAQMSELHEIAHHDLPVIPLWQTVNYFAYRSTVGGIDEAPLALYQDIEAWRASPHQSFAAATAGKE